MPTKHSLSSRTEDCVSDDNIWVELKEAVCEFVPMVQRLSNDEDLNDEDAKYVRTNCLNDDLVLTLKSPAVYETVFHRFSKFRINRELCDVVLCVNDKEIYAHKIILAAISPTLMEIFFRSHNGQLQGAGVKLFSKSNMSVFMRQQPSNELQFYEFCSVDPDCLSAFINFAYTSHFELVGSKLCEMYNLVSFLQLNHIEKACAEYLVSNLEVNNCIGIRRRINFSYDEHVRKVDLFIARNMSEVVDCSVEFSLLTCVKLRLIVSKENSVQLHDGSFVADCAVRYFDALMRNDSLENTTDKVVEMLSDRIHLLYPTDNFTLRDCADMGRCDSPAVSDIIEDYKWSSANPSRTSGGKWSLAGNAHDGIFDTNNLNHKSSFHSSAESVKSFATSESDSKDEAILIAVHQLSGGVWIALAMLHGRLLSFSIQLTESGEVIKKSNGSISASANSDSKLSADAFMAQKHSSERSARLSRFAPSAVSEKNLLPLMNSARCSIGAVFANGKIIVCGGYNRGECLRSVEEYDVVKGSWRELPKMIYGRGRFDASVANGKIYAVAGSDGSADLKSAECFDLKSQKWSLIAPLHEKRSQNGCAHLSSSIYCIGGSFGNMILSTCEKYDTVEDKWDKIPPMHVPRAQAACTTWRGLIIACGGCDNWNCLDSVEAYDPQTISWKFLPKLKTRRRGCGVAVVRDSLYVIGGSDGTQALQSVEILDHPSGKWRFGPALTIARANTHCAVTAGNVIYVLGGFDGTQFLSSIEILMNENLGWCNWFIDGSKRSLNGHTIAEEEEDGEFFKVVVAY